MTATMHEPSTARPDRDGIAAWLLVPAFWGRAVLAVRWETSGHDGEPFPVLDADLTLIPAEPGAALLQLAGVYRVGPGEDGHRTAVMPSAAFWTGSPRRSSGRAPAPARAARDPGPGKAGCSALARGVRGPRQ
jgi:hypothetical protein